MHIEAVIGANYGDEGKGMLTEHLCRKCSKPIVVLSNGGCQRGHTVNNVELGIRHVFNHFGSGTLLGVPTVFSKTFLLNPIKYIEEKQELEKLGLKPKTLRAPGCLLQLPSDMFVNQMLEKQRGRSKHGSCGWGIWETKVRNRDFSPLAFDDFSKLDYSQKKKAMLEALAWQIDFRLENGKESIDEKVYRAMTSEGFISHFVQDFEEMAADVEMLESDQLADIDWHKHGLDVKTLVVENAQGLLLDQKYAPADENGCRDIHSTPSQTGLEGALEALGDGFTANDVVANYVSRSYLTRHGSGPFPEYDSSMKFNDATNVYNDYQGSIRFGKLNVEELVERVKADSMGAKEVNIVATHMNELENEELREVSKLVSYEDDSRKFKQT